MQHIDRTRRFGHGAVGAGRYQLEALLGGGGPVEVYRAHDTRFGRAVEVTLFPHGANPAGEQRFHHDIRRLAGLSRPGLVTVSDSGVQGNQAFAVTELIDAEPLSHLLTRGVLPTGDAMMAGAHVADILAYAHQHGIAHRALTPSTAGSGPLATADPTHASLSTPRSGAAASATPQAPQPTPLHDPLQFRS